MLAGHRRLRTGDFTRINPRPRCLAGARPRLASDAATASATSGFTPVVDTLNSTLASPWGLDFLPDGRMLVTQNLRGGARRRMSGSRKNEGRLHEQASTPPALSAEFLLHQASNPL